MMKNKKLLYWILVAVVLTVIVTGWFVLKKFQLLEIQRQLPPESSQEQESPLPQKFTIIDKQLLFTGGYADPSVIRLNSGEYLMYLNRFGPNGSGYFVLTSEDALMWKEKSGIIFPGIATGRAFITDSGVRFYYPGPTPINPSDPPSNLFSSFSDNGFSFVNDTGVRIEPRSGYAIEGPTVIKLAGEKYRMYFDEYEIAFGVQRRGAIWGASSNDGLAWIRDSAPTISAEADVEGLSPWPQVLHPFVIKRPTGGYLMLYNSHSRIFAAFSQDGFRWQKLGYTGIIGADTDGIYLPDGSFRIYFGDFSPETSGVVYTAILKIE